MLMGISVGLGLLSTLATSFAFYWFVRMRRSFRHDLIMLLIQSDLIKALWFVIFPIVTYTRGPIASDSTFCQVSGFFFAVGIESSDVAVLLIALHSAMYIYRPKSGLYPYRWLAYAAYVIVPLLFASLAFADGGYRNVGYYCYLSNRRGWTRLALSWVPRYVLFALILVIYACIYAYVRGRMLHYERRDSAALHKLVPPPATPAAYRDRIRSLPASFHSAGRYKDRLRSVSFSNAPAGKWADEAPPTGPILWNLPRFTEASCSIRESLSEEQDPHHPPLREPELPPPTASRRSRTISDASPWPSTNAESWKLPTVAETVATEPPHTVVHFTEQLAPVHKPGSCSTIPAMFPVCRHALRAAEQQPPPPSSSQESSSSPYLEGAALTPHISHDPLTSHVSRNRDKVRRQLRSLFVYPLLYLVTWIFPFVNHAYGYSDDAPRPAWVLVLSLVSLAVQGAADSAVFTAREKPWRYTAGEGFWVAVGRGRMGAAGVGRTREEVLVEVRNARARRKAEMMDEVGRGEKKRMGVGVGGRGRHWWDVKEYDVASDAGGVWGGTREGL
ncbi:hypothetical protein CONLIGDRAFT_681564 [Coniochaeta ligniaria NRRL 30616]|uniref:G-protein coupled receptors family 1 profile domain-containing protein n=1 Tax=Coniochaeta ligniaria NRRL 30616 TaxID=1408157 RepID=A0A1J7JFX0_9PEZI|nr:hypothetical protein CONLIGDRAFT_681564 [Coniochaeta ligniaria NRRL 30616]